MQTGTEKNNPPSRVSVIFEQIDPLTLGLRQLNRYREAKKNAFMAYHQASSHTKTITFTPENYYAAFANVLQKFETHPANMCMFSARDSATQAVLGGLLGEKIKIQLHKNTKPQKFFSIVYLFVEPTAQKQGIGTGLIKLFTAHAQGQPLILAVRADHTPARRLYEKCGFTLVTEPLKPDGRATQAVHALLTTPEYVLEEFVAYIYTPHSVPDPLFVNSQLPTRAHKNSYT